MRWLQLILVGLVCLGGALPARAAAERRVALVIGNSAYQNTMPLSNPRNDAADIASALRDLGFDVLDGRDLDKRGMDAAITRFARASQDADVALFFYAGHGMQFQGQNYLIPTDAKIEDEFNLQFEVTRLDDILSALQRARGTRILVLDACRDNPLANKLARASSRAIGQVGGLARVEQSQGMVIAYATQSNRVAADGGGRNSPFTSALVREIGQPGVEIGTMFRRVAVAVNQATGGRQLPELSVSLLGEFYFKPVETDAEAWSAIRTSRDPTVLSAFVARFPASPLADAARARLDVLDRDARESTERERFARAQGERERELGLRLAQLEAERRRAAADERLTPGAKAERDEARQAVPGESVAASRAPGTPPIETPTTLNPATLNPAGEAPVPQRLGPRERSTQVATLQLPTEVPASGLDLSGRPLVTAIQGELSRLGCLAGRPDGNWSAPATKRALRDATRLAGLSPAPDQATGEFLRALRERTSRLCPLVCPAGRVERGGSCIARVCPSGQRLGARGSCNPIPRAAPVTRKVRAEPAARSPRVGARAPAGAAAPSGKRCFSASGRTYCE